MMIFCVMLLPCFSMCELLVIEMIFMFVLLSSSSLFISWSKLINIINVSLFNDKMSLYLGMMTLWISSLMMMTLSTYKTKKDKMGSLFLMIILMIVLLLMFFSSSSISFLVLFELSMIPTMLLIIGWGYQPERLEAFFNFFFFTSIPSLPLLVYLMMSTNSSVIFSINPEKMTLSFIFFMVFAAFLVKVPLYFTHFWLPKAHVEAPVAGSMILAGILLKMGGYGMMRFIMYSKIFLINFLITSVSSLGMVMTCFMCLLSPDLKSIIAYSSVSHMNFMITGIFSEKSMVFFGGLMLMLSHALSSSGLFYMCDVMYKRSSSRSIILNKSVMILSPLISFWWFILCMMNMAFPFTPGNLSEIFIGIILVKSFSFTMYLVMMLYFFFSAFYSVFIFYSVNHGVASKENLIWTTNLKENLVLLAHLIPCMLLTIFSFSFVM
uniref:NADH-ubiquinone oxidoreductase chain 4 n=1 Tax=Colpocephalum griffoneae TaxID=2358484 RepID=A0A386B2C4_9NEOP|nr:NADH dehydrogenase subunit 4 [Colpocephalum griffoneae]AYC65895.1 NADH dehydrogenase subunit 4 [Colpocephalum griffoneae]